jgi:hypothetical protein
MSFIQRIALLLHIAGFLAGLFSVLYIYILVIDSDGDDLTAMVLASSPLIGWLLRWLLTGEIAHFVPLKEYFIEALPLDGNFGIALVLLPLLSFSIIYYLDNIDTQYDWEIKVFETKCVNDFGDKAILGYFKKPEKALPKLLESYYENDESDRAIHCSHYLEKNANGETLCTWNDGSNAGSLQCQRLKENPKPSPNLIEIALINVIATIIIFYVLTLIRLLNNLRKIK